MKTLKLIIITLIITALHSCSPKQQNAPAENKTREYESVRQTIEQSIGWAIEKDIEAMYRLWADDMFHFWLFSDSKVVGLDSFREYSEGWKDPDFRGTGETRRAVGACADAWFVSG